MSVVLLTLVDRDMREFLLADIRDESWVRIKDLAVPAKSAVPSIYRARVAVVVSLLLLLLVGAVIVVVQRDGIVRQLGPGRTGPYRPGLAGPYEIVDGREFDPQGDPPNVENTDEVPRAFDGDPATRWRTVRYIGNPKLGGLKRGVGIIVDLGTPRDVAAVEVTLSGNNTTLEVRVPESDPAGVSQPPTGSDAQWRTVSRQNEAGPSARLELDGLVTTRFVLVYLTSLPEEGSGYRGGIYEIEVS